MSNIDRGYMLPNGEWRLFTGSEWVGGALPRRTDPYSFDELRVSVLSAGYAVPDADGWELRGDTAADGWVITGPATAPTA